MFCSPLADLIEDGFAGEFEPYFQVILAEMRVTCPPSSATQDKTQSVIGYALYFFQYCTAVGGRVLHLEDLFIRSEYRSELL